MGSNTKLAFLPDISARGRGGVKPIDYRGINSNSLRLNPIHFANSSFFTKYLECSETQDYMQIFNDYPTPSASGFWKGFKYILCGNYFYRSLDMN